MDDYVKGGKRDREESHKGKSPSKSVDARTSNESKEANKGKRLCIISIIGGAPQTNLPYKRTMKRKIVEMLSVHKKDGSTSVKALD